MAINPLSPTAPFSPLRKIEEHGEPRRDERYKPKKPVEDENKDDGTPVVDTYA